MNQSITLLFLNSPDVLIDRIRSLHAALADTTAMTEREFQREIEAHLLGRPSR